MPDVFTKAERSVVMSRIRGKDTRPERAVRSMLHGMGYRFRLHGTNLPGRPDIVLRRYQAVIFVHGCFWHRHKGCRFAYTPKSRKEFWLKKLNSNVTRDCYVKMELRKLGWHVFTVWECELRHSERLSRRLDLGLKRRWSAMRVTGTTRALLGRSGSVRGAQ
jgi:DNA mismatch endonuclease (patch repair protein)